MSALFCGCETEPATAPVNISPSSGIIHFGESLQLTATGGYDYQWSVSSHNLGYLSVNTGPSTVYTSIYQGGGTNALQEITVNSTIVGTQTGGTNTTTYAASATAYITHQ